MEGFFFFFDVFIILYLKTKNNTVTPVNTGITNPTQQPNGKQHNKQQQLLNQQNRAPTKTNSRN
jgi:hypothetical protein